MRKNRRLVTFVCVVFVFSFVNISIIYGTNFRSLIGLRSPTLQVQNNPDETNDCSYLNCSNIPEPFNFPLMYLNEAEDAQTRRRLIIFRNVHEEAMYRGMKRICEHQKAKWERTEPSLVNNSVKIFWINPESWFTGFIDRYLDECSVGCKIIDKISESDIVLINDHMSFVENDTYSKLREEKMLPHQKLAHVSLENAFFNHYNDLNKFEIMIRDVDYLVHIFPFADVPIYYKRHEWNDYQFDPHEFERVMNNKSEDSLVSAFISNCPWVESKLGFSRTLYINELGKYINVDHYGGCPHFQNRKIEPKLGRSRRENKFLIAKQYKFTIAFENSIFYNYYTEKLADVIGYSIPVYMGAPNLWDIIDEDLEGYKIFVDANDFPDPSDLANYLKYLDQNESAYREYFKWLQDGKTWKESKYIYHVDKYRDEETNEVVSALCRLCEFHVNGKKKCHMNRYKKRKFITGFN